MVEPEPPNPDQLIPPLLRALLSFSPQEDATRNPLSVMTATDPARALRLVEELCDAFYTHSADAILLLDRDAAVLSANAQARRMLAREGEPLLGLSVSALLEADSAADIHTLLAAGYMGEVDGFVRIHDGRQGTVRLARLLDGAFSLLILQDNSRAHRLEVELQRAQGLAGLGHLAADMADAVVNPLGIIQGRLELMLSNRALTALERVQEQLEGMREHAHRIERAVLNLQAVAAPRTPVRAQIAVRGAVDAAVQGLGRQRERLSLTVTVEPPSLEVFADGHQFQQIVSNLLWAAALSTPFGRRVTLRAEVQGDRVVLVVEDEGAGLSPGQLRAFRSARSNQMPDPVVGLPLAITWVLVHQNDGQMEAHNRPHLGTRCRVLLPQRPRTAVPHPRAAGAPLSLLVVDDDKMLCETVEWMLSRDRCRIQATYSAEDALQLLRQQPPPPDFDVILIDIRLPGMDGQEFLAVLGREFPHLTRRAVLISALSHRPTSPDTLYLQKPFQRVHLLEMVRRIHQRSAPQAE